MKKTVLVSGASGFLGSQLIRQLIKTKRYKVLAYTSKKEALEAAYEKEDGFQAFNHEDWKQGQLPLKQIDLVVNCAFARSSDSLALAESLNFTSEFIGGLSKGGVGGIINISSQSVYSQKKDFPAIETTQVIPESLYGIAKYASELIVESICNREAIAFTNIRLGSLTGPSFEYRLTNRFVERARKGEALIIEGGRQMISYLDVRDAAAGLIVLLDLDTSKWKTIYNLGSSDSLNIVEVAELVKKGYIELHSMDVVIEIKEGDRVHNNTIISDLFYQDTSWQPQYTMEKIIRELIETKK